MDERKALYECACKVVELDTGEIALGIIVAPFDSEEQASACAEFIREDFSARLRGFFEQEGFQIDSRPHIIRGQKVQ